MAAWFAVLAVAGIAAQAGTQLSADKKRRKAERDAAEQEARFLEAQAARTRVVQRRQLELLEIERNEVFGDQVNAIAANNIDLSGSALSQVINDQLGFDKEAKAIEMESDFDVGLALMRAREQRLGAERIRKSGKIQDTATILGGASGVLEIGNKYYGAGTGKTFDA
jgi:hypothetical protein